jgi:hypothetical protein
MSACAISMGVVKLPQALIRDKRVETLFLLPASQTRDKDALTEEGVGRVIAELRTMFDWVICDSPAGIERGATLAMRFADAAVIVANSEVSSDHSTLSPPHGVPTRCPAAMSSATPTGRRWYTPTRGTAKPKRCRPRYPMVLYFEHVSRCFVGNPDHIETNVQFASMRQFNATIALGSNLDGGTY